MRRDAVKINLNNQIYVKLTKVGEEIYYDYIKKINDYYGREIIDKYAPDYVDGGFFIDYDGSLTEVFVDGYLSNLGLQHRGIRQGQFLATKEFWENLMKTNKIEVNWANK